MESIDQIRQMMAEHKFYEAQKLVEGQLAMQDASARPELLQLYYEVLIIQNRTVPINIIKELIVFYQSEENWPKVSELLELFGPRQCEDLFYFISQVKAQMAEKKGRLDDLQDCVSAFLIFQFEHQNPFIPRFISDLIEKYFKQNFSIRLQELSLTLLVFDLEKAEVQLKELILSCIEKASPKGTKNKLESILHVLNLIQGKGQLEIYQNLCLLWTEGLQSKADFKKVIEAVIYFDDFRFQVIILQLLQDWSLNDEAQIYANSIRNNKGYSFVYLDKYYQNLKPLFVELPVAAVPREENIPTPDLSLEDDYQSEILTGENEIEEDSVEKPYIHLLKHQTFKFGELCDLAVSFLQSEMPKVALLASNEALKLEIEDTDFLKASYLKITALLQLQDYRAALDVCLEGLGKARLEEDVLSFMYAQAEIHLRLGENRAAKKVLTRIVKMNDQYRLAKERLEKLNEI